MVLEMKRLRDLDQFKEEGLAEVNMSPLVDMVFLLLIFFMVTSVFVKQQVVEIVSPNSTQSHAMKKDPIMFSLTSHGEIYFKDQKITTLQIKAILTRALLESNSSVVILADESSRTKDLITLMDFCREAGAKNVSVATNQD